jgi:hypothetical protein
MPARRGYLRRTSTARGKDRPKFQRAAQPTRKLAATSRETRTMTDKTIDLDGRRGMEAQKATDLRRLLAEVEANERSLRLRQEELEAHLADAPAASWEEAAEKVRYVLGLYAATLTAEDTRRRTLVEAVLEDLERLASAPP